MFIFIAVIRLGDSTESLEENLLIYVNVTQQILEETGALFNKLNAKCSLQITDDKAEKSFINQSLHLLQESNCFLISIMVYSLNSVHEKQILFLCHSCSCLVV
jgi:hypothetical protein